MVSTFKKCLMQPSLEKTKVLCIDSHTNEFHKLLWKLIKTDGKDISSIPKFHGMFSYHL